MSAKRMIRWAALITGLLLGSGVAGCGSGLSSLESWVVVAAVALFLGDVANTVRPTT